MSQGEAASACAADIAFDEAQAMLASQAAPLGKETIALAKAGRRCLAEPVIARIDAPRHATAAMDGFALRAADLAEGRSEFRIVGSSFPAQPHVGEVGPGEAIRITTGAPLPPGADQVVMIEHASLDGDAMALTAAPAAKRHVRPRASDFAAGAAIVPAGRLIDPRTLVAVSACDVDAVTVWRRPRVAVLASGDELAEPGSASASPHGLPDSLSEAILLLCHQWGAKPIGSARAKDDPAAIGNAAAGLVRDCDVLVVVGGASRGVRDFTKQGLAPLGLDVTFADVAIKPGKPVWYGRIGRGHVLGLPGNPTAAMTAARLFLVPLLTGLGGRGPETGLRWTLMPLTAAAERNGDRESFLCGEVDGDGVRILDRQSASAQGLLADADLLVRRLPSAPALPPGATVPTLRF